MKRVGFRRGAKYSLAAVNRPGRYARVKPGCGETPSGAGTPRTDPGRGLYVAHVWLLTSSGVNQTGGSEAETDAGTRLQSSRTEG